MSYLLWYQPPPSPACGEADVPISVANVPISVANVPILVGSILCASLHCLQPGRAGHVPLGRWGQLEPSLVTAASQSSPRDMVTRHPWVRPRMEHRSRHCFALSNPGAPHRDDAECRSCCLGSRAVFGGLMNPPMTLWHTTPPTRLYCMDTL